MGSSPGSRSSHSGLSFGLFKQPPSLPTPFSGHDVILVKNQQGRHLTERPACLDTHSGAEDPEPGKHMQRAES